MTIQADDVINDEESKGSYPDQSEQIEEGLAGGGGVSAPKAAENSAPTRQLATGNSPIDYEQIKASVMRFCAGSHMDAYSAAMIFGLRALANLSGIAPDIAHLSTAAKEKHHLITSFLDNLSAVSVGAFMGADLEATKKEKNIAKMLTAMIGILTFSATFLTGNELTVFGVSSGTASLFLNKVITLALDLKNDYEKFNKSKEPMTKKERNEKLKKYALNTLILAALGGLVVQPFIPGTGIGYFAYSTVVAYGAGGKAIKLWDAYQASKPKESEEDLLADQMESGLAGGGVSAAEDAEELEAPLLDRSNRAQDIEEGLTERTQQSADPHYPGLSALEIVLRALLAIYIPIEPSSGPLIPFALGVAGPLTENAFRPAPQNPEAKPDQKPTPSLDNV